MNCSYLFSRIFALCIVVVSISTTVKADENGFHSLFNGKDLTGWDGNTDYWSVEDGVITARNTAENPLPSNSFLIWRNGTVDDFELNLQYRIVNGNSGIQYRSHEVSDWVVSGYQGDFEAGDRYSGILYEEKGRGILALRGEKAIRTADGKKRVHEIIGNTEELNRVIKKEQWNNYRIVARGNHIQHYINGQLMMDFIDRETGKAARTGLLALQVHQGPPMTVQFKDIQLKRLPLKDILKIVMVAGKPSHDVLHHEHNAGIKLLTHSLNQSMKDQILVEPHYNGWPADPSVFDNADGIVLYMDGFESHPLNQESNVKQLQKQMDRGVGLACIHYACGAPKEKAEEQYLAWIGGNFEQDFSDYPHWEAKYTVDPNHAIANGVKDDTLLDEWYFNIRFRPEMKDITPLLSATPPDDKRKSKASKENMGREEVLSWSVERPDGGRGFGFTGGHYHLNWGNDNFRKFVLNAIVWTAGGTVPKDGVESTIKEKELYENLDEK